MTTRSVVSVCIFVSSAGLGAAGVRLLLAQDKVERQQQDLAEAQAKVHQLHDEADALRIEVREVQMLHVLDPVMGDHVVSPDGRLEMFTWHVPSTGQLCAHWCARSDPGGPCLTSGPDRCLPNE